MRTAYWAAAAATLAVLPIITACGSRSTDQQTAATAVAKQTVAGTLVRVGGPSPGSPVPLPGEVRARSASGALFSAKAGEDGKFRLLLPTGTYELDGHSPRVLSNGHEIPCAGPRDLRVVAGQPQSGIQVICSIR